MALNDLRGAYPNTKFQKRLLSLIKRTSILPTIVSRKSVPFEGDLLGEEAHR